MAGYRTLPLAPVSATAMATVSAQPNGPTMYHHQSMTAMSNNGIIYQSAVHASIHSLNTVQNQRSTTHHILATATATAAAAVATATARQYAATGSSAAPPVPPPLPTAPPTHLGIGHQPTQQQNQQQHQHQQLQSTQQHQQQHHQQQQQLLHHQQRTALQQQQQQQQNQHQQQLMAGHHHHQLAQHSHTHPHHPHHHHHHHHHPHPHHPHAHQQIALHQNLFFSGTSLAGHAHHRQLFSHMQSAIMPLGVNGDPIKLPDNLESLPRADSFPSQRHRWNTNEEIAAILISFDKHNEWQSKEVKTRPKSGSLLLYSRKKVRYRRDGYCWKKRKDGKTTREDHMKLKVQGTECIYGCYVHSAILPTFHRRCYWLLQNPDIVLVHYLNVPYPDDNKMAVIAPSISLWGDKKEWTKEELVSQLKPMLSTVTSDDDSDSGNDIEISTAETVESIVCQLMEKQRLSRQAALVKQLDCGCGDASCADGKTCTHPVMRRPSLIKASNEKRLPATTAVEPYNPNNTPNVVVGPKLYSRWADKRAIRESSNSMDTNNYQHHHGHGHHGQTQQLAQESAIKFQIITPHNEQQQQQHFRHHYNTNGSNSSADAAANHQQLIATRNNLIMQHQQQQQMHTNQSNFNQAHNQNNNNTNHNTNNNNNNLQRYTTNNSSVTMQSQQQQQQHRFQIAKTTITAMDNNTNNQQQQQHSNNNLTSASTNNGGLTVGGSGEIAVDLLSTQNHSHHTLHQQQNQAMSTTNSNTNNKINHNTNITSSNSNNANHNTTNQISHSNQTITTTSSIPVATNSTSNIATSTTTTPQLMSTPHHHQQNNLNVINNNNNVMNNSSNSSGNGNGNNNNSNNSCKSNSNNATTKFNNYNQQQLNASNNSNNNNSLNSHTANQQQQQKHSIPQEQYYKLQHHKQQQQSTPNVVAVTSTVEPMCMSPEHQPSPQSQLKQPQQQTHLRISSSDSISESASSISPSPSLSSSSQTFMDVNQKSSTPVALNSSCNNNNNNNNIENTEMSSNNNDLSINTSNINNNDSNNRNNQLNEYNNCNINNKNTTGCATSSSDASNCNNNDNSNKNKNNSVTSSQQQPLNSNSQNNNHNNNNINRDNLQLNHATPTSTSSTICFDNLVEQTHHDGNQAQVHSQQQQQQQQQPQVSSELHDTLGFFNETLDLSHEDIQRTLIANMPGEGTLLTSLDFINSSVSNGVSGTIVQNAQCEPEPEISRVVEADDEDTDDVFANLDAFDMLVEFPELDLDDKQALTNTALEQAVAGVATNESLGINSSCQNLHQLSHYGSSSASALSCDKKVLKICDFSPDWSYPEGGVKVLVAGPWSSDAHYTVLFDSQPVPTVLVQEGVLRCYCPSHEVGYATLQVSCDGFAISDSVMFEYKMMSCQEAPFDANTNDCLYKFSLYNRLTTIEETMQIKGEAVTVTASQQIFSLQGNLEEKLVSYCHRLVKMSWQSSASISSNLNSGYKGMTLLHLAAALGYNKLVCALLNWRTENPHIILETEIDAFSQDSHGYTPLTWACSRGHLDTAILLYKWNQNALKIKNHAHQTPLDVAHNKGHKNIVSEIYRLEHERQRKQSRCSLTSLSINLNKYSLNNDESDDHPSFAIFDSTDSQRSHDGVFLRPVAVSSNQSPPNSSRFSKRSSIDSGISMDIRTKPIKSFKDLTRLHSLDAHENFSSSIESPLDTIGTAPNTTNSLLSPLRKMDFALCEVSTGDSSPLPDKNNDDDTLTIDNDDCNDDVILPNKNVDAVVGDSDAKVLTLAEHIIAAMPERIKNEADEMMVLGSPMTETLNTESTGLNDSFMDPLLDTLPNAHFDNEFNFDFNDHSYRYHEVSTPCSSLSPASSGPLQSPASYSILGHDPSVSSPSPPPSTKQLTEFLHASSNTQYPFEADFSKLTLTDTEQRELYEAAKCIQKAYRSYKGRQKLEEQNKERTAAIVIQNYYRRYKQFAYYRQMTNAALVIQHGYRSYCRNKRFKKSQTSSHMSGVGSLTGLHNTESQDSTNSQCLSSFFDNFNKQENESSPQTCTTPKETSPSGPLKRTYSQSTQNQAARKIQQFMRQSRIKLQKERAEKERLVHQRREEYLQNLQYQGQPGIVCPIEKNDTTLKDFNELVSNGILKNNNHVLLN